MAEQAARIRKSYGYVQLEAVAWEMRNDPDMVYYYEYQLPISALPTGEVLDLATEFGTDRTSGAGWPIDEQWIVGAAIGAATAGPKAIARLPSMAQIYSVEYIFNQAGKIRARGRVRNPWKQISPHPDFAQVAASPFPPVRLELPSGGMTKWPWWKIFEPASAGPVASNSMTTMSVMRCAG